MKHIKSTDESNSKMISTQHAQCSNSINPKHYVKNRDAHKILRLAQGTSSSLQKMKFKGILTTMN